MTLCWCCRSRNLPTAPDVPSPEKGDQGRVQSAEGRGLQLGPALPGEARVCFTKLSSPCSTTADRRASPASAWALLLWTRPGSGSRQAVGRGVKPTRVSPLRALLSREDGTGRGGQRVSPLRALLSPNKRMAAFRENNRGKPLFEVKECPLPFPVEPREG